MKLIFNTKDFEHIPEKSKYNHNVYKHKNESFDEICEICHEDYDYYEYSLIDHNSESVTFLGCSQDSLSSEKPIIEIDFRMYYT